jgi:eukaryotic-like serine/threonine-protein kinase
MAELFLAVRDGPTLFEREVVLKCIRTAYADDPEFLSMFADEARIGARLAHPGIAKVLAYGSADGCQYLAIEHVSGEDLEAVIHQARASGMPFPISLALSLCAQVAEALHHAHTATDIDGRPLRIVHRDVTPANVMVTPDARVKLLDFGIAKAAQRVARTSAGFVKGKIGYMSPEHLAGEKVDATTDVFSLGCMLYEMLTLHLPFEQKDDLSFLEALALGHWTPLLRWRPDASARLESVLRRALGPTPAGRFQSAHDLQIALEQELRKQPYLPSSDSWAHYRRTLEAASAAREAPTRVTVTDPAMQAETVRVEVERTRADRGGGSPSRRATPAPAPRDRASLVMERLAQHVVASSRSNHASRSRWTLIGLTAIGVAAFAVLICSRFV